MRIKNNISQLWIKSAVIGSLWASSEIVLGSLLHNLKVPFRSQILTALAIIIVLAIIRRWKENGIVWRSALIAAFLKSISPSAVIFGPMIAIFMEGLLMEISLRVFRYSFFAYIVAGAMAMSWNFVHFLLSKVIIFGGNIIELYKNIVFFLKKQTNIDVVSPINLLIAFLLFYVVSGILAALVALRLGSRSNKFSKPLNNNRLDYKPTKTSIYKSFNHSIVWLLFDILAIVGIAFVIIKFHWIYWIVYSCVLLILWYFRYTDSFKKLLKPTFLVSLVVISIVTVGMFYLTSSEKNINKGILAATEMSLRAIVIVLGFSAIGIELKNKRFQNLAQNSRLKNVNNAIQIGFDTLPEIIASLPPLKYFIKKPIVSVQIVLSYLDYWFLKTEFKTIGRFDVVVITGPVKSGKTTFLSEILRLCQQRGIVFGGIVSPAIIQQNQHKGYWIMDLISQKKIQLSTTDAFDGGIKVGNYYFYSQSYNEARKWLKIDYLHGTSFVVVDEIGPWELRMGGWAEEFNDLVRFYPKPIIIVVRETILEKVLDFWAFDKPFIVKNNDKEVIDSVVEFLCNYSTKPNS